MNNVATTMIQNVRDILCEVMRPAVCVIRYASFNIHNENIDRRGKKEASNPFQDL